MRSCLSKKTPEAGDFLKGDLANALMRETLKARLLKKAYCFLSRTAYSPHQQISRMKRQCGNVSHSSLLHPKNDTISFRARKFCDAT